MSNQQRIDLGTKMVLAWSEAGRGSHRSVLFVQDMLVRLQAGKKLSPKQAKWFDDVVASKVPEVQNKEKVDRLLAAAAVAGMDAKESQILKDFASTLGKGYALSERQAAFMEKLVERSEILKVEGPWTPSEQEAKEIILGINLFKAYNPYYTNQRPGLVSAVAKCLRWKFHNEPLDKFSAQKVMTHAKAKRSAMRDFAAKNPIGSLVSITSGQLVVVMTEPYASESNGAIMIDVLLNGKLTAISVNSVTKESKKKVS